MRKFLFALFIFSFAGAIRTSAQELIVLNPDTLRIATPPVLDSSLYMKSIFGILSEPGTNGAKIKLIQSRNLERAVKEHIESAPTKKITGFRVRIYFDNKQNARGVSQEVMNSFLSKYPSIRAYWSHESPFFKVTVGDFRNRSEAMRLLNRISAEYPAAFVVRENINFPPLSSP